VREAELLCALDLAVPVGALHQPHHEAQAVVARDASHLMHGLHRARLVGLDRQPETAPARVARPHVRGGRLEELQRELEPLALLRVDREIEVGARGRVDQLQQARQQLGVHPRALRALVAREQRRQLDRDAVALLGPVGGRKAGAGRGDRRDRLAVGRQVAPRVLVAARALAQHVEREAQPGVLAALAARLAERLGDRLAEHELAAEQLEGAHGGGHHALGAEPPQQARRLLAGRQEALGQVDRAGRQPGQAPVRIAGRGDRLEVGAAELVGREGDGGLRVRHAQQRLRQPHQRQALGAGERVLAQQRLQGPERRRMLAHALHPRPGLGLHGAPVECAVERSQSGRHHRPLGAQGRGQPSPGRQGRRCGGQRRVCAAAGRAACGPRHDRRLGRRRGGHGRRLDGRHVGSGRRRAGVDGRHGGLGWWRCGHPGGCRSC
jgi:hypothetical protein